MNNCGHIIMAREACFRIPHPLRGVSQGVRETVASGVEALGINGIRWVRHTASLQFCSAGCAAKEAANIAVIVGRRPRVIEVIPTTAAPKKRVATTWSAPAHLRVAARMPRWWRIRRRLREFVRRLKELARGLSRLMPRLANGRAS